MSSDLFFYTSSDDEDEVTSELAFFTEACSAVIEASNSKISRTQIDRDHYGVHNRLVAAYFCEHPLHDDASFRMWFRMSQKLFTQIVREVTDHSLYFQQRPNCTRKVEIYSLIKCTSAIWKMAYRSVPDALGEYLQMGATIAREYLVFFCDAIMELYGEEFLRKPTYTDIEKIYARHEEKHGFPGMIGSIDCTDWPWENCPIAFKAQFCRSDHGPDPFILLEEIASEDLWIWHAFFGISGMNNDVNVLRQSPIFNDLKAGKAPDVPFVANNVSYKRG